MRRTFLLLACIGISLLLAFFGPFITLSNKLTDLFFTSHQTQAPITIVAIDDASISPQSTLGRYKDWPRTYFAQAIRELNKHNPAVIGLDLDFREQSGGISSQRLKQFADLQQANPSARFDWGSIVPLFIPTAQGSQTIKHPDDIELQKTFAESKRVVLPAPLLFTQEGDATRGILPVSTNSVSPIFSGVNIFSGFNNALLDRDGVLRRALYSFGEKKNFAAVLAEQYSRAVGRDEIDPRFLSGEYSVIRYSGKPGKTFNTISFADVVAGRIDPKLITNRIVIIGSTAGVLHDDLPTPASSQPMPGVEILANQTAQMLDGAYVSQTGVVWIIVSVLLFVGVAGVLFLLLSLKFFVVLFAVLMLGLPIVGYILYQTGSVVNVVHPLVSVILTAIAVLWYRNQTELKAKKALKNAFAHYVSPLVVNELIKDPSLLSLGGKRETITVLFSDIVGFTTLSEKLSPEDTVALLNDYLTAMTEVIFEFGGTLDKYQGDAIMALFGAPMNDKNHATNAVHAALRMRQALVALHDKWNAIPNLPMKDELLQLDFRVGIATGPAVIGNVGSQKRFDYTAIGDIVNLGSRLEAVNRKYGTRVIVNKATFTAITESANPFAFRKLDVVRVKGKSIETEIFEVYGISDTLNTETKAMLDDFENARVMYTERNFLGCKEALRVILDRFPEDGPSAIYKNRCEFFLRKPPNIDWSPIVSFDEK